MKFVSDEGSIPILCINNSPSSTSTCNFVSSLIVIPEPENCGLNGILTLPKSTVLPISLPFVFNSMTSPCGSSSVVMTFIGSPNMLPTLPDEAGFTPFKSCPKLLPLI